MERIIRSFTSVLGVIATLATVVMMVAISTDVFYRLFYQRSVPGILEISETALVAAVFLGMAYTGSTNSHIQLDLLTERLPAKVRQVVVTIAWALTVVFCAWATYATTLRAMASTQEKEIRMGLVNWPMYPSRWLIAIGFAAMLVVAIWNLVRTLGGREVMGFTSPEQLADAPVRPFELTEEADEIKARLGSTPVTSTAQAQEIADSALAVDDRPAPDTDPEVTR
ncbi:MAG: TRAP transporter small permease [bacterium]|nr:TRAP transporter small permease [bacterium]